jgi:uncharacterized protein (DUF1800 family)
MPRGRVLVALLLAACASGLAMPVYAADAATARDEASTTRAQDVEDARIRQLARRATFGATPQLIAEIRTLGRARWLDAQLAPQSIADPTLAARLARYPSLDMDSATLLARYPQRARDATNDTSEDASMDALGRPARVLGEVSADVVTRAVHARAQLAEVMTDFWLNHFNVYAAEGPTRWTCVAWVRDTIRPHALGRFRDLLQATASSPAMLYYLDNYLSRAPGSRTRRRNAVGINENYARELLELHTLGVTGGYTQADVENAARVFTGWTITPPRSGRIEFRFAAALHDGGDKVVLGQRIASGGRAEGEQLLDLLARSPATAAHVVRKLVSRFVADVPPESLVQRAQRVWLRSDGDLAAVLRTILESDELFAASSRDAKVKSPLELVASALRAAHADVRGGAVAAKLVGDLGQPILRAEPPTGWAETADAVVTAGGMVTRFDVAARIAQDRVAGVRVDPARWTRLATGPRGIDALAADILLVPPSDATHAALVEARDAGASNDLLAALVLSSPEFQQQ